MLFYVNPSMLGLGNPRDSNSVVRKLMIGGYHAILKVSMRIDKTGFTTNLEGQQQGFAPKPKE